MYIRNLQLVGIKLIEELELDFTRDGQPRMWTVLIGENGTCKTTILQAIAMLSSGERLAALLANNGRVRLVPSLRPRHREGRPVLMGGSFGFSQRWHAQRDYPSWPPVALDKRDEVPPPTLFSTLLLDSGLVQLRGESGYLDGTFAGVQDAEELTEFRTRVLDSVRGREEIVRHWFVAGYGVDRNLPGSERTDVADPVQSRLLSLFGGYELTGLRFHDWFRQQSQDLADAYEQAMTAVVEAHTELFPGVSAIDLTLESNGTRVERYERQRVRLQLGGESLSLPASWLSQGYQSALAWVADLVGQIINEAWEPIPPGEMEGLVLVDEIDLHLHPTWQVGMIEALRSVFPRLQFVVTTHSPLVLPAFRQDEVVRLVLRDGQVVREPVEASPETLTATEVQQRLFGLPELFLSTVGQKTWEYSRIAANPWRTDEDDQRLRDLETWFVSEGHEVPAYGVAPRKGR